MDNLPDNLRRVAFIDEFLEMKPLNKAITRAIVDSVAQKAVEQMNLKDVVIVIPNEENE